MPSLIVWKLLIHRHYRYEGKSDSRVRATFCPHTLFCTKSDSLHLIFNILDNVNPKEGVVGETRFFLSYCG